MLHCGGRQLSNQVDCCARSTGAGNMGSTAVGHVLSVHAGTEQDLYACSPTGCHPDTMQCGQKARQQAGHVAGWSRGSSLPPCMRDMGLEQVACGQ